MSSISINKLETLLKVANPEYANKAGFFLCLSGTAEVLINNELYQIKRGTIYVISPLANIYRVSCDNDFCGIHMIDDIDVIYSAIHPIIDTMINLKIRNNLCLQLNEEQIKFLLNQKERIDKKKELIANEQMDEAKRLYNKSIHLIEQETVLELVSIFYKNDLMKSKSVSKSEAIIYSFIYSLHINHREERSVAFYARQANLSIGHFSFIVKSQTEKSPSDWISAITIVDAKLLLQTTTKSIKEIAKELNFPEQYTFGKYFKQYTDLSPKAFRQALPSLTK